MLAEIAAANAAFAVIKKAVENGRELVTCGKAIGQFVTAHDDLRKLKDKKKNSIWSAFSGKEEHDLEEFMALEELKQKEEELKQMMIYLGRPGLHSDYVKFCVEARKRRAEEAAARQKARDNFVETCQQVILWFLIISAITGAFVLFILYAQKKGWL